MIGQLDIVKNREYASKPLGKDFDLRDFHYQVLSQGSVPLEYLSDHIQRYIRCKKDANKAGCGEILRPPKVSSIMSRETTLDDVLKPMERPGKRHFL